MGNKLMVDLCKQSNQIYNKYNLIFYAKQIKLFMVGNKNWSNNNLMLKAIGSIILKRPIAIIKLCSQAAYWGGPYYSLYDRDQVCKQQGKTLIGFYALKFMGQQKFSGQQFYKSVIAKRSNLDDYAQSQYIDADYPKCNIASSYEIIQQAENRFKVKQNLLRVYKYDRGMAYDGDIWKTQWFVDAKVIKEHEQGKMKPLPGNEGNTSKRIVFNPIKSTSKLFREMDRISLISNTKQSKCLLWQYSGIEKTSFFLQLHYLGNQVAQNYWGGSIDMNRYITNYEDRSYYNMFYTSLKDIKSRQDLIYTLNKQMSTQQKQKIKDKTVLLPKNSACVIEGIQIYYDLMKNLIQKNKNIKQLELSCKIKQLEKLSIEDLKKQLGNQKKNHSQIMEKIIFFSQLLQELKDNSQYIIFNSPKIENRGLIHDWNKQNNTNYFDFDYHPNQSVFKYQIDASESAFDILIFEVCMVLAKEGWTEIHIQKLKSKILEAMFKDDEFDSVCVEPINIVKQIHLNSAKIIEYSQKSQDQTQLTKLRQLLLAVKQKLKKEAIAQKEAQNPFYKLLQQTPQSEYIDTFYYMNWLRKQSLQLINSNITKETKNNNYPILKLLSPQKIMKRLEFKSNHRELENAKRLIFGIRPQNIKKWTDFFEYQSPLRKLVLKNPSQSEKFSTSEIFERVFSQISHRQNMNFVINYRRNKKHLKKAEQKTTNISTWIQSPSISGIGALSLQEYCHSITKLFSFSQLFSDVQVGCYFQENYKQNTTKFCDFMVTEFIKSDKGVKKQLTYMDIAVGRIHDRLRQIYKDAFSFKSQQSKPQCCVQKLFTQSQEQRILRKAFINELIISKLLMIKQIRQKCGPLESIFYIYIPKLMMQEFQREKKDAIEKLKKKQDQQLLFAIYDINFIGMEDCEFKLVGAGQSLVEIQLKLLISETMHDINNIFMSFDKKEYKKYYQKPWRAEE